MARPRLLDLFCGAGGAAMGYHRAGFDVVGVDNRPQPRYPFPFVQADALAFLAAANLASVAAIHGSPVCKRWSAATPAWAREGHPDQIAPLRKLLLRTGKPWVIENVPRSPVRPDLKLCGCMFGLPKLRRERWFETSWRAFDLRQGCQHRGEVISVVGGGDGRTGEWRSAMGIDWMGKRQLNQAIPPAYTEYIGRQLLEVLRETPPEPLRAGPRGEL
jgi:DNA (cytosine-5)-methyltransferase 1